jgi:proteic killer suppression protein
VIESFRHKGLKRLYHDGDRKLLPPDMIKRVEVLFGYLDAASTLDDLSIPSLKLHQLTGARKEEWAVSVNGNWRIVFRFENGAAKDLNFEDYH